MKDNIEISCGPFSARLLSLGAVLNRFQYNRRDLILGFKCPRDYQNYPIYAGAIVGPVANRISHGQITISGNTYQMQRNENGITALHSGDSGLHNQHWELTHHDDACAKFLCALPDGHGGLPGLREITVTYTMTMQGLTVAIHAQSDRSTPINIAHHPYWAFSPEQSEVNLKIAANHYLPKTDFGLPSGEIASLKETPFDYTERSSIKGSLDHNFCLSKTRKPRPQLAAQLTAPDGLCLRIETTEPGLQVYTGDGLPTVSEGQCIGQQIKANAGIALEPQGWPDAPNHSHFPSIILAPNQTYHQITHYKVAPIERC